MAAREQQERYAALRALVAARVRQERLDARMWRKEQARLEWVKQSEAEMLKRTKGRVPPTLATIKVGGAAVGPEAPLLDRVPPKLAVPPEAPLLEPVPPEEAWNPDEWS